MDSMPPATMISLVPAARRSCASIAAFIPEPHILLTVVQPVASGSPAPIEACRAGAWPCPAGRTQPMMTSCTCSGLTLARSTAARMAAAPSSGAANLLSSPWNAPIGVRATETITIGSFGMGHLQRTAVAGRHEWNLYGFAGQREPGGQRPEGAAEEPALCLQPDRPAREPQRDEPGGSHDRKVDRRRGRELDRAEREALRQDRARSGIDELREERQ